MGSRFQHTENYEGHDGSNSHQQPDADAPGLLSVPHRVMGALIGPRAGLVLDLQKTYGNDLFVQKLGHKAPDGGEMVQVVGTRWKEAKVVIEEWLERKGASASRANGANAFFV